MIYLGLVDDQKLFLSSLSVLINTMPGFSVRIQANGGEELLSDLLVVPQQPDIILIDVRMRGMNGWETATRVREKYPNIKLAALSMNDEETAVIQMLKAGCCAYFLKDLSPDDLQKGLQDVYDYGYHNADSISRHIKQHMVLGGKPYPSLFSDREKDFLKLACSDMTYKEIASIMCLSQKTIDGYRESLFAKLNVKSRVGMALEAIRANIVSLQ